MKTRMLLTLAMVVLVAAGCSMQKKPANEAVSSIEASLAGIKEDAAKYAPDGLKGVESTLAQLKENLAKEDYKSVLAGAPELTKAVGSLKEAVVTGKAHAEEMLAAAKTEWEGLSADVSRQVDTIQKRIDELSKAKRLPWGINKDEFAGSKSAFESMKAQWNEATAEASKGDAIEANVKAKTAKGMGDQLYDQLKIKQT